MLKPLYPTSFSLVLPQVGAVQVRVATCCQLELASYTPVRLASRVKKVSHPPKYVSHPYLKSLHGRIIQLSLNLSLRIQMRGTVWCKKCYISLKDLWGYFLASSQANLSVKQLTLGAVDLISGEKSYSMLWKMEYTTQSTI